MSPGPDRQARQRTSAYGPIEGLSARAAVKVTRCGRKGKGRSGTEPRPSVDGAKLAAAGLSDPRTVTLTEAPCPALGAASARRARRPDQGSACPPPDAALRTPDAPDALAGDLRAPGGVLSV